MDFHWSTHQLTEYFGAVSSPQDEHTAITVAVERAAEALEAEVGIVVINGQCRGSIGFGPDGASEHLTRAVLSTGDSRLDTDLGELHSARGSLVHGTGDVL